MYTEIIANLSAAGFLGLAFGSGILYQKVQEVKISLIDFKAEQVHECEKKHANDKEILTTLATLSAQVETLITGQKEFRKDTNKSFEDAARKKSHSTSHGE